MVLAVWLNLNLFSVCVTNSALTIGHKDIGGVDTDVSGPGGHKDIGGVDTDVSSPGEHNDIGSVDAGVSSPGEHKGIGGVDAGVLVQENTRALVVWMQVCWSRRTQGHW